MQTTDRGDPAAARALYAKSISHHAEQDNLLRQYDNEVAAKVKQAAEDAQNREDILRERYRRTFMGAPTEFEAFWVSNRDAILLKATSDAVSSGISDASKRFERWVRNA